jgi:hypothetical protein
MKNYFIIEHGEKSWQKCEQDEESLKLLSSFIFEVLGKNGN